jgi:hypothetical protein
VHYIMIYFMLIWFIAHLVLNICLYSNEYRYMPICVNIINLTSKHQSVLSQCVHLQLIKNGTQYFFVHQTSCSTIKNVQHSLEYNRYLNILHTRIRNNCSALRNDLFHDNLIHNPSCSCGYSTENAEHFLGGA